MVFEMFRLAADLEVSPRVPISSELVGSVMFSGGHVERFDDRAPEVLEVGEANPRVAQIRGKVRTGYRGRQAGAQDEAVQHQGRHLRSAAPPLLDRPHDGGLRRGEPRLGRRISASTAA